jgi:UDP-N-acetylmuramate--alanine ligase
MTDPTTATAVPASPEQLPAPGSAIHFVGIGGIGMSGLARLLHRWDYRVSGSDATASEITEALTAEGIAVSIGHADTALARAADLVVITAAVRGGNPEVEVARENGVPVIKRARLLGLLADSRRGVAVAGSHGKSTTSGMLVVALAALGGDPSYAIGAVIGRTGTNAAAGTGAEMVVEADEYDHSFLQLHPDVAIVNNVDYDHPDLFPDQAAYDRAFVDFIGQIRRGGTLVIPGDDEGADRVARAADQSIISVVTFGESPGSDWRLVPVDAGWLAQAPDGERYALTLQVPGTHNARNALAALVVLVALGHDPAAAAAALGTYTGIGRRFEHRGDAAGVTVIDDYAHHPKEVAATIAAAGSRFLGRRIAVAFQPHTYSRTHALLADFADALAAADLAVILDIYAARETDTLGTSAQQLVDLIPNARAGGTVAEASERLASLLRSGDVLLTVGAGTVTALGPLVLERLGTATASDEVAGGILPPVAGTPSPRSRPVRRDHALAGRSAAETVPGADGLKIQRDAAMSLYTTWRIGGPADALIRAADTDQLVAAVRWGRGQGVPVTIFGGGSNLLVPDDGIRGLVVLARTPGDRAEGLVESEDLGDHVRLRVGAQAPLSWTGRYAAERGWAGLDWGVGLPGTVGGATVNNAGAHGTELKDHLSSVTLLGEDGNVREEPASWLDASYRHSRIKSAARPRSEIVLASTFLLPKGDSTALVALADDHARFRRETQPTGACAGSVFANPPGDFAGRLLEDAGLKGFRIGGAQFSPKHANWIVNTDRATAADVRDLIAHAQRTIRERDGIELRVEVERFAPDGSAWADGP